MAKEVVKVGSTSRTEYVMIYDSSVSTGVGLTGLAYNTANLVASYVLSGAARTAITLATQTVSGAWSSGGFVEVDATNCPGLYRIDIPNAAFASGNKSIIMLKGATNMAPVVLEYQLTGYDSDDSVRMGMTSLPSVAFNSAGGLSSLVHVTGTLPSQTGANPSVGTINLQSGAITADNQKVTMLYVELNSGVPVGMGIVTSSTDTNDRVTLNNGSALEWTPTSGRTYQLWVLPGVAELATSQVNSMRKNVAFNDFMFKMVDATDLKTAKTGISVTATRSIDGNSFSACTNSGTEVASGWYKINLSASDLNGNNIVLRFTGTGCHPWEERIVTQPT